MKTVSGDIFQTPLFYSNPFNTWYPFINDQKLNDSDAVAVENESDINIKMLKDSEFLLFDLA